MPNSGRNVLVALFRNDLRIHDNPILHTANALKITHVLPVFVFDERIFDLTGLPAWTGQTSPKTGVMHLPKTGVHRTRFIAEAVFDLRDQFRKRQSDLHITYGIPERILEGLIKTLYERGDNVEGVSMTKEFTSEEITLERRIESILSRQSPPIPLHLIHHKTLVHPDDLPFPPKKCPDVFTSFRKAVEGLAKNEMVRPCLDIPNEMKPFPLAKGEDPNNEHGVSQLVDESLDDTLLHLLRPFGPSMSHLHQNSAFPFKGGETAALERLDHYFTDPPQTHGGNAVLKAPIATYKQTRNGLVGIDYSSKFSAYLALGCLSPRLISQKIDEYDAGYTSGGKGTKDTYWLRFELLWRDYFAIIALKYGNQFYKLEGIRGALDRSYANNAKNDWKASDLEAGEKSVVKRWLEGRTGVPFIDANMIELKETGYMSNRGRQNVASFLAKNLGFDWRIGAEIFEELLLDYDPMSNYGNWMYAAGVGTDPRDGRQFNPIKQAKDYDPDCVFIKTWIPSLSALPNDVAHHPWTMRRPARAQFQDVDWVLYGSAPVGEEKDWANHYKRKGGQGSKINGNPKEKV